MGKMLYFDFEFNEFKINKTDTVIDKISIGIVDEWQNKYYAVYNDFDIEEAWSREWLVENVLKQIFDEYNDDGLAFTLENFKLIVESNGKSTEQVKQEIIEFVGTEPVSFHAYYADYDWVLFCQTFGGMMLLPDNYPMICLDLKQMMEERCLDSEWKKQACPDPEGEHNALVDAEWNRQLHNCIMLYDMNKNAKQFLKCMVPF